MKKIFLTFCIFIIFSCKENTKKNTTESIQKVNFCRPLVLFDPAWNKVEPCDFYLKCKDCCRPPDVILGDYAMLLQIRKNGQAEILFEELDGIKYKTVVLNPLGIFFQKDSPLWRQDYYNDSLNISVSIINSSLLEKQWFQCYNYESSMVLKLKGNSYSYQLEGKCNHHFIDSLYQYQLAQGFR